MSADKPDLVRLAYAERTRGKSFTVPLQPERPLSPIAEQLVDAMRVATGRDPFTPNPEENSP